MRRLRHALVAIALMVSLAGCGVAQPANLSPEFTECGQTTDFAFVGETSLSAIGLGDAGSDSSRVGMVWVTADAIPMGGAPDARSVAARSRRRCGWCASSGPTGAACR